MKFIRIAHVCNALFRAEKSGERVCWLCLLAVLGFLIYWPGFHIAYFGDDYQLYFGPQPPHPFHHFLYQNPLQPNYYRPIQWLFSAVVQAHFGLATLPIHLVQCSVHVLLSWLIYAWMVSQGFRTMQAFVASFFMLVSQANAMVVLNNDTFSQMAGPLFGCLSLWTLHRSLDLRVGAGLGSGQLASIGLYGASVVLFALALLWKETSTSFFPMAFCIVALGIGAHCPWRRTVGRFALLFCPFAMVMAGYFGVRSLLDLPGPRFGTGPYDWNFGTNVVKHLGLFVFQAFLPASSVGVFTAFSQGEIYKLVLMGVSWLLMAGVCLYGVHRCGRRALCGLMVVLFVLGLFPVVLMNHVSELYLYNSMPFFAVLVGIGCGEVVEESRSRLMMRVAIMILMACLAVSNVVADRSKALLMDRNGDLQMKLESCIAPYLSRIPPNGWLILVNPDAETPEYSTFRLEGFNVFKTGFVRFKQLANREDFQIRIVHESEQGRKEYHGNELVLQLDQTGQCVQPFKHPYGHAGSVTTTQDDSRAEASLP